MKPLTTTEYLGTKLNFSYRKSKHSGATATEYDCFVEFSLGESGYKNMAVVNMPVDVNEEDAMSAFTQAAIDRLTPWAQEIINDHQPKKK